MLPSENRYGGWSYSDEIDIMEMLGRNDRLVYGTLHYFSSIRREREIIGETHELPMDMPSFNVTAQKMGI